MTDILENSFNQSMKEYIRDVKSVYGKGYP